MLFYITVILAADTRLMLYF